jgi:two-component system, response regulator PdtaR
MKKAAIFIVEDEAIVAEDIRETVKKLGYSVCGIARSGEVAIEKVRETRPDLVLMDIHLAGPMDGVEAARQIYSLFKIPVIYITAHADDELLERAKVTEPYGYILKPYDERELHSVIEMAQYKHGMEQRLQERERTIRALANAIPDAMMLLDRQKQVIAINETMAQRLDRNADQVTGFPVAECNKDGSLDTVLRHLDAVIEYGRKVQFEQQDRGRWYEIALYPIPDIDRSLAWIVIQYHDITDRKEFEDHLKREGISQIEHNMEQFQILNDQIRNPLQAIMGYIDLDCILFRPKIGEQIKKIDNIIARLDHGWVESEKVRNFLLRHYRHDRENMTDGNKHPSEGGRI